MFDPTDSNDNSPKPIVTIHQIIIASDNHVPGTFEEISTIPEFTSDILSRRFENIQAHLVNNLEKLGVETVDKLRTVLRGAFSDSFPGIENDVQSPLRKAARSMKRNWRKCLKKKYRMMAQHTPIYMYLN